MQPLITCHDLLMNHQMYLCLTMKDYKENIEVENRKEKMKQLD